KSQSGNQASEPPPTTIDYLQLLNSNSVSPNPSPTVSSDNVCSSNTRAQSFSEDTSQPSTLSILSSLQDTVTTVTDTIPPSCIYRPKISRTRCG
ncbi:unnamed protein product, partial [Hymenolepis diminuta]